MYSLHSNHHTNSRLLAQQQTQRQGYASGRSQGVPSSSASRLTAFCLDSKRSSGPSATGRGAEAPTSTTSSSIQPPAAASSSKPAQPASSASCEASNHRAPEEPLPLPDEAERERKRRAALPIWPRGSLAVAILGGGEADSQRLWPLTRYRTLPAIPFGGVHRCGACTPMPLLCALWPSGTGGEGGRIGSPAKLPMQAMEPRGCKPQA